MAVTNAKDLTATVHSRAEYLLRELKCFLSIVFSYKVSAFFLVYNEE